MALVQLIQGQGGRIHIHGSIWSLAEEQTGIRVQNSPSSACSIGLKHRQAEVRDLCSVAVVHKHIARLQVQVQNGVGVAGRFVHVRQGSQDMLSDAVLAGHWKRRAVLHAFGKRPMGCQLCHNPDSTPIQQRDTQALHHARVLCLLQECCFAFHVVDLGLVYGLLSDFHRHWRAEVAAFVHTPKGTGFRHQSQRPQVCLLDDSQSDTSSATACTPDEQLAAME